jgi:putative hydrolase of the HAD superfamily
VTTLTSGGHSLLRGEHGTVSPQVSQDSNLLELNLNIVFDLGGVVFNWKPEAIIRSIFNGTDTQDLVRRKVFEHIDWVELDRGSISLEQAIDRGAARTGLRAEDIERLLRAVPPFLTPIETTVELIQELSSTRNRLFVLSNMHLASIAYLEQRHTFWDVFEGIVISSRVKMVKPEIQIFEYLLDQYQLNPNDTVFIDDLQENLAAASSIGIQTIRFTDSARCRRALVDLECF